MYTHVATGCTEIGDVQTGDVQNWKCITTLLPDVKKLEMYKIRDVQAGDVQKLEMYNHSATGCINYIEPDVQKKSLSKPINMGSNFEDLDTMS